MRLEPTTPKGTFQDISQAAEQLDVLLSNMRNQCDGAQLKDQLSKLPDGEKIERLEQVILHISASLREASETLTAIPRAVANLDKAVEEQIKDELYRNFKDALPKIMEESMIEAFEDYLKDMEKHFKKSE